MVFRARVYNMKSNHGIYCYIFQQTRPKNNMQRSFCQHKYGIVAPSTHVLYVRLVSRAHCGWQFDLCISYRLVAQSAKQFTGALSHICRSTHFRLLAENLLLDKQASTQSPYVVICAFATTSATQTTVKTALFRRNLCVAVVPVVSTTTYIHAATN